MTNIKLSGSDTYSFKLLFERGYTGHEHLSQFGLINMNARLYDPVLGRFISPDPLVGSPDMSNSYNRYVYASNNPLMYVDLDGEKPGDGNKLNVGNDNKWINYGGIQMPDGGYQWNTSGGYYPMPGSYNSSNMGYPGPYSFGNMGPYNYGYSGGGSGWGSLFVAGFNWLTHYHRTPKQHTTSIVTTVYKAPQSTSTKITLAKPATSGWQTSYSGGQRRMGIGTTNSTTFDIDAAVDCLINRAHKTSRGKCATYVRIALEAGGINTKNNPVAAKDYSSFLINKGFEILSKNEYLPIKGDIAVFESFQGRKKYHQYGHIQMYSGDKFEWVSDFKQSAFWAGRDYRDYKPEYKLLRFKKDEKENDYNLYNFWLDIF